MAGMAGARWVNAPATWRDLGGGALEVTSAPRTDFWQRTHYGFRRDSGAFLGEGVHGDFLAQVKVTASYQDLYDQAGLMIRADEDTWLKCGVEYVTGSKVVEAGGQQASVVVTRGGFSDWSVVPLNGSPPSFWIRAKREKGAIHVSYSLDGEKYQVLRLAYLSELDTLQVGRMACSPEGDGFKVVFEDYSIQQ